MVFAGALMLVLAVWQIFMGIAALVRDEFFIVAPNYIYEFNIYGWGLIHLLLGILMGAAGIALFNGAVWARAIGIALAILLAISNFFFLPYYPIWSLVVIATDIFLIWSLASADRPRREA
jgi:hypothetical protein